MKIPRKSLQWKLKVYPDSWYLIYIGMIWGKDVLADYVRAVFIRFPIINYNKGHFTITVLYTIVLILALPGIVRRIKQPIYYFLFPIVMVMYFLNYLMFFQNVDYLNQNILPFFLTVFPMLYLGLAWDVNRTMNIMYRISMLAIACSVFYQFFVGEAIGDMQARYAGDMQKAYELLPHICLVGYYTFSKINVFNIGITILGTIYLLALGNRGSVLCLTVFWVLLMLLLSKIKNRIIYSVIGSIVICVLVTGNRLQLILTALGLWFRNMGMSARVVSLLGSDVFFISNGRNRIQQVLLNAIKKEPIFGYGIFGDRVLTNTYAHNLILELLIDFGVVIGAVLILLIFLLILKKYGSCKSEQQKAFLVILVCASIMRLMLSWSYLQDDLFFLLMGFVLAKEKINYRIMKKD